MKICSKCTQNKELSNFYNRKDSFDGLQAWCKACDKIRTDKYLKDNRERVAKRKKQYVAKNKEQTNTYLAQWRKDNKAKAAYYTRTRYAKQLKATPKWADVNKIKDLYELAAQLKYITVGIEYHVDHIVPLTSDIVCGLHVENNMQILRRDKNLVKSNKLLQEVV